MSANMRQTAPEPTCGTLWVTCDNSPTGDGTGPQKAPEGTEDMKSIDRLREYVCSAPMSSMTNVARAIVVGMTDEIEREVKELTDERDMLKTQWEAGVDFDQRFEACADNREDVTLFGVDYTPLPVDADGVPIHVGDVMEWDNGTFTVHELKVTEDGWTTWDEQHGYTVHADETHHHAPTVEDVLREFVERLDEIGSEDDCAGVDEQECRACIRRDIAAAYAEYAAKLTLRGDE